MKLLVRILNRLQSVSYAMQRFPTTIILLFFLAIVFSIDVAQANPSASLYIAMRTIIFGVFLSLALHAASEKPKRCKGMMYLPFILIVPVLALVYFLKIFSLHKTGSVDVLRLVIVSFIFLIFFLWIQALRFHVDFGDVFMAFFKAIFTTAFFVGIAWGGLSLILTAVDQLLIHVPENLFGYLSVWSWVFFAPILLISLLPLWDGSRQGEADKQSHCPNFLRILLLYVVIPLIMVYSVVLLMYLAKSFSGNQDQNLLESLILSYCIAVIAAYILTGKLEGKILPVYRLIFPKIMGVVALYQVVVSASHIRDEGIMYGRYFVLVFCVFSVVAAILMSVLPIRRTVLLAIVLTGFAAICVIPPLDAFSISGISQSRLAKEILTRNNMLVSGEIVPNDSLGDSDNRILTASMMNLCELGQQSRIDGLSDNFTMSNYNEVFGVDADYYVKSEEYVSSFVSLDTSKPLSLDGYTYAFRMGGYSNGDEQKTVSTASFVISEDVYKIIVRNDYDSNLILDITDSDGNLVLTGNLSDLMTSIPLTSSDSKGEDTLSPEEMTFDLSSEEVKVRVVFFSVSRGNATYDADMLILVRMAN